MSIIIFKKANDLVWIQRMYEMQTFVDDITGVSAIRTLTSSESSPLMASMAFFELIQPGPNVKVKWNHGHKHFASKNITWTSILKSTKKGPAKYLQGANVEAIERFVWANGTPTTNGK